jgi:hypothetical protein
MVKIKKVENTNRCSHCKKSYIVSTSAHGVSIYCDTCQAAVNNALADIPVTAEPVWVKRDDNLQDSASTFIDVLEYNSNPIPKDSEWYKELSTSFPSPGDNNDVYAMGHELYLVSCDCNTTPVSYVIYTQEWVDISNRIYIDEEYRNFNSMSEAIEGIKLYGACVYHDDDSSYGEDSYTDYVIINDDVYEVTIKMWYDHEGRYIYPHFESFEFIKLKIGTYSIAK